MHNRILMNLYTFGIYIENVVLSLDGGESLPSGNCV